MTDKKPPAPTLREAAEKLELQVHKSQRPKGCQIQGPYQEASVRADAVKGFLAALAAEQEREAAIKEMVEAVKGFISERDNPVPDLALKARYYQMLRAALKRVEEVGA